MFPQSFSFRPYPTQQTTVSSMIICLYSLGWIEWNKAPLRLVYRLFFVRFSFAFIVFAPCFLWGAITRLLWTLGITIKISKSDFIAWRLPNFDFLSSQLSSDYIVWSVSENRQSAGIHSIQGGQPHLKHFTAFSTNWIKSHFTAQSSTTYHLPFTMDTRVVGVEVSEWIRSRGKKIFE